MVANGSNALRAAVRGVYDLQKLRIMAGNRVVANYKAKRGQAPSSREEVMDAEGKRILQELRREYHRITDGIVDLPKLTDFTGTPLIADYTEFALIRQYIDLIESEEDQFARLTEIVETYPIYTAWMSKVAGLGPAMGAVLLSELRIEKARYASSLWMYAGLDVVTPEPASDNYSPELEWIEVDDERWDTILEEHRQVSTSDDGVQHKQIIAWSSFNGGEGRSRWHKRTMAYTDKDGVEQTKEGLGYNPFLKSKLIGVLAGGMLKAGTKWGDVSDEEWELTPEARRRIHKASDGTEHKQVIVWESPYRVVYLNYKHRMEGHAKYGRINDWKKDGDGHIITCPKRRHLMSMRYMIKRFLADLYEVWRPMEGLPVYDDYAKDKLGRAHGNVA